MDRHNQTQRPRNNDVWHATICYGSSAHNTPKCDLHHKIHIQQDDTIVEHAFESPVFSGVLNTISSEFAHNTPL